MRSLTPRERDILYELVNKSHWDKDRLRAQVALVAQVEEINPDGTILRLQIPPNSDAASMPQIHFVLVEGLAPDVDGIIIHVMLHVCYGMLYELEFVREDCGSLMKVLEAGDMADFIVAEW